MRRGKRMYVYVSLSHHFLYLAVWRYCGFGAKGNETRNSLTCRILMLSPLYFIRYFIEKMCLHTLFVTHETSRFFRECVCVGVCACARDTNAIDWYLNCVFISFACIMLYHHSAVDNGAGTQTIGFSFQTSFGGGTEIRTCEFI